MNNQQLEKCAVTAQGVMAEPQLAPAKNGICEKGYNESIGEQNGRNLFWTTEIGTELPILSPSTGVASEIVPMTFPQLFRKVQYVRGHNDAMKLRRNGKELTQSWIEFWQLSQQFSKSLEAIGVEPRKTVNICGFNRPEWAIAFYGRIGSKDLLLFSSCQDIRFIIIQAKMNEEL